MPQLTIQLRIDPATGKKDIVVQLRSEEDALPHEHEQQHRALVEKLIQGGLLKASEVGKIIVEREEEEKESAAPVAVAQPAKGERRSAAEGQ